MRIGCQTFTWEMLGDRWLGKPRDLVSAISAAGYEGIEISNKMIGTFDGDVQGFRQLLADHALAFVAYAFSMPSGFTVAEEEARDLESIRRTIAFLAPFSGTVLSLGCPTDNRSIKDEDAISIAGALFNKAGEIGREHGVTVAFHPSSHHGSVVFDRRQYELIMKATDPSLVRWVPDTGHILRGRQSVTETLGLFRDRISYVHLKDAAHSSGWRMMGTGDCDIAGVVRYLKDEIGFSGWLVAEEEAPEAGADPNAAVAANRRYLASLT